MITGGTKIMPEVQFYDQKTFEIASRAVLSKTLDPFEKDHGIKNIEGGECMECGATYELHDVVNRYANYREYVPTCQCWKIYEDERELSCSKEAKLLKSGIPEKYKEATIGQLYLNEVTESNRKAIMAVVDYLKKKDYLSKGLLLWGDPGTGKTHCAASILRYLMYPAIGKDNQKIHPGYKVRFVELSSLNNLCFKNPDYILDSLQCDYVVIDDMDKMYVKGDNSYGAENAYRLINGLVNKGRKMIITNQQNPDKLKSKFDPALWSRIVGGMEIVHFTGNNWRVRQGEL